MLRFVTACCVSGFAVGKPRTLHRLVALNRYGGAHRFLGYSVFSDKGREQTFYFVRYS